MEKITFTDIGKSVKISFGDKKGNYGFMELELPKNSTPLIVEEDNVHLVFFSNGDRIIVDFNDVDNPADTISASDLREKLSDFFFKEEITFDVNAQVYFNDAGITDIIETNAANTLIVGLKDNDLWTRMKALYLMSPTSLAAAAVNARSPGTFDITWVNSPTHSVNGVAFNGTTQYGKTGLIASSALTLRDTHRAQYNRTNNVSNGETLSARQSSSALMLWVMRRSGDNFDYYAYNTGGGYLTGTIARSDRLVIGTRRSDTDAEVYRDGSSLATDSDSGSGTLPTTYELYLSARNNVGSAQNFDNRQISYASIGLGLTDAQVAVLTNLVTTYQETVITEGRDV